MQVGDTIRALNSVQCELRVIGYLQSRYTVYQCNWDTHLVRMRELEVTVPQGWKRESLAISIKEMLVSGGGWEVVVFHIG